jgi:probable addiction module antidote protein
MTTVTRKFDVQDYLRKPKDRAAYLDAALEDGDPALVAAALGDIAKAEGMTAVARSAGLTREGLYKALSKDGDPRLSTLLGVAKALGLRLTAEPVDK